MKSLLASQYERDVADYITVMSKTCNQNLTAVRPIADVKHSDVLLTDTLNTDVNVWLEVKMNETDNLSNPRLSYANGKWHSSTEVQFDSEGELVSYEKVKKTNLMPTALACLKLLNENEDAKIFVNELAEFCNIDVNKIIIPSTKSVVVKNCNPNIPSYAQMKEFVDNIWKMKHYICKSEYENLGKLVRENYLTTKNVHYMSSGDNLYLMSDENPLNFKDIPLYSGDGTMHVRVSLRKTYGWYEIQPELKIKPDTLPKSEYSVKPGSKKLFPVRST